MKATHLTNYTNLESIKKHGLVANKNTRHGHVGHGIYVLLDKKYTDFADYLGLDSDPLLCLTIEVDPQKLLMDEDALVIYDQEDIIRLRKIMPQKAFVEYTQYLKKFGGNDVTEASNNDEALEFARKFKTALIDKYQIRPHPEFTVAWVRYDIPTARCIETKLMPTEIQILFDDELYSEEEFKILEISGDM